MKKTRYSLKIPGFRLAAGEGFEPSHTESESAVLPLHNPAKRKCYYTWFCGFVKPYFSNLFKKSIRIFRREIGLGVIQVMADKQVNTGAVALEAQLLVIALQKPLMDGVGNGLDRGLKL